MPCRQVSETRVVHGHRRAFVRAGKGPALLDFIATTEPAAHDLDSWRRLLSQNWDGVPWPVGR
jgi:hypothetical protein